MTNVVDVLDLLPIRIRDTRIMSLHAAFGTSRFDVFAASEVLGLSYGATWDLLFHGPMLKDGAWKVAGDNGGFRLLAVAPEREALPDWKSKYLPIMRSLPQPFGVQTFADAASIPFVSSNFMLSLFLKHGIIEQHFNGDLITYRCKPKPKVIFGEDLRPRRRVIYTGY